MGKFNEELVKAGVNARRRRPSPQLEGQADSLFGHQATVFDGPFTETKELVAGFWIWKVKNIDEAVEWVKRCPNPHPSDSEIEIRPLFRWRISAPSSPPSCVNRKIGCARRWPSNRSPRQPPHGYGTLAQHCTTVLFVQFRPRSVYGCVGEHPDSEDTMSGTTTAPPSSS